MESSDDEIIDNNNYDEEFEVNLSEKKSSNDDNNKITNQIPQNNNDKNNVQIKNSNTVLISKKQNPKSKQIVSVSVILPKKTQNQKRITNTKVINNNINKNNNNPFRNQETRPKFKTSNEVYQEIKTDIDIQNHNNVLLIKKESNNAIKKNLTNKIKKNKIESITVKNNNIINVSEIGNNIIKKIDKINEDFLSNTFLKTNNNNIKQSKTKKKENKTITRND